jgi:hypothetical protein
MVNNLIKTCKIITTLRKEILMRNQGKVKNAIKKITYQDRKGATISRDDENAVEVAQSILNAQIQSNVIGTQMPTKFFDNVDLDWYAGTIDDSVVSLSRGDFKVEQNLLLSNGNVKLRMPQEVTASYGEYEGAVRVRWRRVLSSSGYMIYRNFGLPGETLILNNTAEIDPLDNDYSYFVDNVGNGLEHTYTVIAKNADPEDNSEMTAPVTGKGYTLVSHTISLSGYESQTITTPANATDITLSVTSIAGSKGSGATSASGGLGNGFSASYTGAQTIFFGSAGSTSTINGAPGYFSGGNGYGGAPVGGGAASVVKVNGTPVCGAGGGGGGGALTPKGGGGGGVLSAGGNAAAGVAGAGGSGGGGAGKLNGGNPAQNGSTYGSFSSTGTNAGAGYVNATLTWRE